MSSQNTFKKSFSSLLKKFLSVHELQEWKLYHLNKVLIVRQHNQFGDMLASVSLFRALKEKKPSCRITLIASPENYFAVINNSFIDRIFVFDKKKLLNPFYLLRFKKILSIKYDVAIVPATVAISNTSCLLAGLSKAKIKIGPKSLDGVANELSYMFNYRIELNWKKNPDAHVSDFIQDTIRPFGVMTKNFSSDISFGEKEIHYAKEFIKKNIGEGKSIIGFHVGAGKPQNRWSVFNFIELLNLFCKEKEIDFYFTGSSADDDVLEIVKKSFPNKGYFINQSIPRLAALISLSNLFITNDTGVMHVAGATKTPQVSLFGPTNPFNWAPTGKNKFFIRRSELMNDITVNDVFFLAEQILEKK
jgi:heptosyltransferase-2